MKTTRKPYRVTPKRTDWHNADGTSSPVVRLFAGSRGSIACDFSELPRLIADLERLRDEHENTALVNNLFKETP